MSNRWIGWTIVLVCSLWASQVFAQPKRSEEERPCVEDVEAAKKGNDRNLKWKTKMKEIFTSAKSEGGAACQAYMRGPKAEQSEGLFGLCIMWAAHHVKNVSDCNELKRFGSNGTGAGYGKTSHVRCVALVAGHTKNHDLCKSQVKSEDLDECIKYSKDEFESNWWGSKWWEECVKRSH